MAMKKTLSSVAAKLADPKDVEGDKPKVKAGIDTDGSVFQITLPLMVKECDLTMGEGKKQNGDVYDKASVCFEFQAKNLYMGVQMDDGTIRYYKVKNNAGPYGPTRYISLGIDPSVFFTRPPEPEPDEIVTDENTTTDAVSA